MIMNNNDIVPALIYSVCLKQYYNIIQNIFLNLMPIVVTSTCVSCRSSLSADSGVKNNCTMYTNGQWGSIDIIFKLICLNKCKCYIRIILRTCVGTSRLMVKWNKYLICYLRMYILNDFCIILKTKWWNHRILVYFLIICILYRTVLK